MKTRAPGKPPKDVALVILLGIGGCTSPSSVGELPFASTARTIVVAHRGGALEAPENTLEGVRHGVRIASDWQEIDVRLSADQFVVVMHDATVDRTTSGSGTVGDMPIADLQRLSAGNPGLNAKVRERLATSGVPEPDFGERFAEERVPTLEQVLGLRGARLMIEIKTDPRAELVVRRVLDVVQGAGARDRVAIASSDQEILRQVVALDPVIPLIGIAKSEEAIAGTLTLPVRALAVRESLVDAALNLVPTGVAVWAYTAYTPDEAMSFIDQGVDGVVTDAPRGVLQRLRSRDHEDSGASR